jgi:hypothetical protein
VLLLRVVSGGSRRDDVKPVVRFDVLGALRLKSPAIP